MSQAVGTELRLSFSISPEQLYRLAAWILEHTSAGRRNVRFGLLVALLGPWALVGPAALVDAHVAAALIIAAYLLLLAVSGFNIRGLLLRRAVEGWVRRLTPTAAARIAGSERSVTLNDGGIRVELAGALLAVPWHWVVNVVEADSCGVAVILAGNPAMDWLVFPAEAFGSPGDMAALAEYCRARAKIAQEGYLPPRPGQGNSIEDFLAQRRAERRKRGAIAVRIAVSALLLLWLGAGDMRSWLAHLIPWVDLWFRGF